MSNIAPLTVLSAVVPLGAEAPDWTLRDGEGLRSYAQTVQFDHAFSAPPVVQLGVCGVDASKDHNLRLRTRAEDIRPTGFTLVVETWLQTQLWAVDVSWLAIGS